MDVKHTTAAHRYTTSKAAAAVAAHQPFWKDALLSLPDRKLMAPASLGRTDRIRELPLGSYKE